MNKVVGFAMCGSFCTFKEVIPQIEMLKKLNYDIVPIMSEIAYETDTRFGKAEEFRYKIETICKHEILHTIPQVEPIGPKKMLDILVIAPCTGNTAAKLVNGITDTSVTMAAKSHLRNGRPVVIAVSTNDGLACAAKNIGSASGSLYPYPVLRRLWPHLSGIRASWPGQKYSRRKWLRHSRRESGTCFRAMYPVR